MKQELIWPESLSHYVAHYSTRTEASPVAVTPASFIRVIDSDIGRSVGFKRVAVHHVVLPPGCRTSSPHAESHEEEFVYVIKGQPHLWLNGYIHDLDQGYAVGFPAGTGVAHTFINNTLADVHLIVAGEMSKNQNLCAFPINPELKADCPIWWADPPQHPLGPHNGLPGPIRIEDRAREPSPFVARCEPPHNGKPFHYPGDNEKFGSGLRITDVVGLKALGIWIERLPPGRRAAFPHAHTHEEEFAFVLSGHPTVWLDGFAKKLEPGDFAAFPANTGLPHTLINDTDQDAIYLAIGETAEFVGERISYPHHPLRQHECRRKGWYWDDLKRPVNGPHSGAPARREAGHLQLQICTEADLEQVLQVFQRSPQYFARVDGTLPTLDTARDALVSEPKNRSATYARELLLIRRDGQAIGALEVHLHHPEPGTAYIGLLLIADDLFGQGLGRQCYKLGEDYLIRAWGCHKIRLGISNDNDVTGFWRKMGFEFNGQGYDWAGEAKTTTVREMEKTVHV